jgi:type I restriction enzyme S subunit
MIRFGEVFNLEYGNNLPSDKRSNSGEFPVYGSNGVVGSHNISFINSPCIVIGRKGSAGALNLSLSKACCVTDVAYYCIPPRFIDLTFSFKLLHTLGLDLLGKGIKPGLNRNEAYELITAIPPLAEQHRIVAKVDELMALCDQLENQHNNATEAHDKLVTHLLGTLTQSQNAEDFNTHWQRISEHFDTLFTTEASIDALKQTLLQLAVMGKLVPQDPNDEPASELLKRIQAEKAKLIAEGKIKKDKPLSVITDEEKPFDLPVGWEWVRLAAIGFSSTGRTPSTQNSSLYNGPIPFIGPGQITLACELLPTDKWISEAGRKETTIAKTGDILMVCIGGSIGKSAIADKEMGFNQQINCISPLYIESKFVHISMMANSFQSKLLEFATGSATPIINKSKWEELLVPVPPLIEQHRIVIKVDELMAICGQLKFRLTEANLLQQKLADVMVEQAIS